MLIRIAEWQGHKYRIYRDGNTIIAVSTYAGKYVKGRARLNPTDTYDEEYGIALAVRRCNLKIVMKKKARAKWLMNYYSDLSQRVKRLTDRRIKEYFATDAELTTAQQELDSFLGNQN